MSSTRRIHGLPNSSFIIWITIVNILAKRVTLMTVSRLAKTHFLTRLHSLLRLLKLLVWKIRVIAPCSVLLLVVLLTVTATRVVLLLAWPGLLSWRIHNVVQTKSVRGTYPVSPSLLLLDRLLVALLPRHLVLLLYILLILFVPPACATSPVFWWLVLRIGLGSCICRRV